MDWLEKISITCFAASYAVVLGFELVRLYFSKSTVRSTFKIAFTIAGLFAHTIFLYHHTSVRFDQSGVWLGSWFGWCLAGAWLLAIAYLWLALRKFNSTIGVFLLPVVLALIAWGSYVGSETHFSAAREKSIWTMVHGMALLIGSTIVALGFVFGVMYLIQAKRLKSKKLTQSGSFRLPSLEWLRNSAEWCLTVSAAFLAIGLLSGVAMNLTGQDDIARFIPWHDPVILSSGILFAWLLVASLASVFYKPARHWRKVAMLVSVSFLFLVLELGLVWFMGHGNSDIRKDVAPVASTETTSPSLWEGRERGTSERGGRSSLVFEISSKNHFTLPGCADRPKGRVM